MPLSPGSEEIVEEARRADVAVVVAGTSPRAEAKGAPRGGRVFVQPLVPVAGVRGPAAPADDTSDDSSDADEDRPDDRVARVESSRRDCSVKDGDTPGTDWVMVALLVRSRMASFTEVASLLEEVLWRDVRME